MTEKTASEKEEEINDIYRNLCEDRTDANGVFIPSIKNQISDVLEKIENIKQNHDTSKARMEEAEALYQKCNERLENLDDMYTERLQKNKEYEEKYNELCNKITDLLPSAASAGLSSGYFESKKHYGVTEREGKNFWFFLRENSFLYIHNLLFLITSFLISSFLFYSYYVASFDKLLVEQILMKALVVTPLLGVIFYSVNAINMRRRLYEEYNHKQRVLQLYDGFKREIETLSDNADLKKDILNVMLDTVKHNPSIVMNKYDDSFIGLLLNIIRKKN